MYACCDLQIYNECVVAVAVAGLRYKCGMKERKNRWRLREKCIKMDWKGRTGWVNGC